MAAVSGMTNAALIAAGMPMQMASRYASSWAFSTRRSANLLSKAARCAPENDLHGPSVNASLAPATAAVTSSGPAM